MLLPFSGAEKSPVKAFSYGSVCFFSVLKWGSHCRNKKKLADEILQTLFWSCHCRNLQVQAPPKKFGKSIFLNNLQVQAPPKKFRKNIFWKNLQVQAPPKNFGKIFFLKNLQVQAPPKKFEIFFLKNLQVQAPPKKFRKLKKNLLVQAFPKKFWENIFWKNLAKKFWNFRIRTWNFFLKFSNLDL